MDACRAGTLAVGLLILAAGCAAPPEGSRTAGPPPLPAPDPAELARHPESDPAAIALAEQVMVQMGGREAWARTRYITWDFFGRRRHVWDKLTGDERIDAAGANGERTVILMNVNTRAGRAWVDGTEVTDPDRLHAMLESGYAQWINDSYWLLMPYKLLDPGVILHAEGERPMQDGREADVIGLTFDHVGLTPQNRYDVYVARDTGLVEEWAYYADAGDATPRFRTPWAGWHRCGRILLSGDRGGGRQLTGIATFDKLPEAVMHDPAPWSPPSGT